MARDIFVPGVAFKTIIVETPSGTKRLIIIESTYSLFDQVFKVPSNR